jgi:hypothetical protein
MGDNSMNRWRLRLAEIDGDEAIKNTDPDVQSVRNVQNVQKNDSSRHCVQIEQIEQRTQPTAPPSATLGSDGPDDWGDRVGALISSPCPEGFPIQRWAVLCNSVKSFADGWAAKATSLGWTFEELFALRNPFANVSLQGAAWFIGSSTVTAVTSDAITLRTQGGATQRGYRGSAPRDYALETAVALLKAELADGEWHVSFDIEVKADAIFISLEDLAGARHTLNVETQQWMGCPKKWRLPDGETSR